jgi:DNA-binding MarR family transcriptional regulator
MQRGAAWRIAGTQARVRPVSNRRRSLDDDGADGGRPDGKAVLSGLYSRPGFLLRRAHQISVALFLEETADLRVTTTQYGALFVLSQVDGLDIVGLGRRLGADRSTSALVISKLEAAGWVKTETSDLDRRRKVLSLTDAGREVLADLAGPAVAARERLLSAFTPEEARAFLTLLDKFVSTFNGVIRTPIGP